MGSGIVWLKYSATSLWRTASSVEYLSIQVRRPIGLTGLTYSAEASGTLASWSAAAQDRAATANGDGSETLYFRDTVPRGAAPRFIRLKVTQP